MKQAISIIVAFLFAASSFASLTKMNGGSITTTTHIDGAGRAKACGVAITSGLTYLLNENCEGTGTPSGWTDLNSVNWDYTATVLNGSQSMEASNGNTSQYTLGSAFSEIYGKVLVRFISGQSGNQFFVMRNAAGNATVFYIQSTATDIAIVDQAGGSATTTLGNVTTGVKYWVWFHYKAGTGANAIAELWVSTTSTQPANASAGYATFTNGSGTASGQKPNYGVWSGTHDVILDDMQLAATAIP